MEKYVSTTYCFERSFSIVWVWGAEENLFKILMNSFCSQLPLGRCLIDPFANK